MTKKGDINWRILIITISMLTLAVMIFLALNRVISTIAKVP